MGQDSDNTNHGNGDDDSAAESNSQDSNEDGDQNEDDDTDSDSSNGSQDGSDSTDSGNNDVIIAYIDACNAYSSTECNQQFDAAGNAQCSLNALTGECYSVVQTAGIYGAGGFDDGYSAAQLISKTNQDLLTIVVIVLASCSALLCVGVITSICYLRRGGPRNRKPSRNESLALDIIYPGAIYRPNGIQ